MPGLLRRRPSPALVISVIALVAAAGGGGFAIARGGDRTKDVKIANRIVTKRAPRLSVAHAGTAETAGGAATATSATSADPAAFAHVSSGGTVDAADSKGITQANVTNGSPPGYFCFASLPFAPRGAGVVVDWNDRPAGSEIVPYVGITGTGSGSCPAGTQLFVDTRHTDASGTEAAGFFITLYH